MRLLTTLLASLALVSAQLPESSKQAWLDSLSATPTRQYAPVAIQKGKTYLDADGKSTGVPVPKYSVPTSAITQWSQSTYFSKAPGWLDEAPTFDPIQYRMPDVTFNATFADGYPRAWHVWFPKDYTGSRTVDENGQFSTSRANRNRFNVWYALHGFTDNAFYPYYDGEQEWPGMPIWSNLTAFTYYNNYILVAPEGLINRVNTVCNDIYPEFAWNSGHCCSTQHQDDVDFITQVRNNVTAIFRPKRQFLTGYSNGGFMVERIACERRGLFDAYLANAAPVNTLGKGAANILAHCDNTYDDDTGHAKPILLVHGKNDQRVDYQGDFGGVSAPDNAQAWAARNGCPSTPATAVLLYDPANPGVTSNYYFNTIEKTYGSAVQVFPPEQAAADFHTTSAKYYGLRRLPFSPSVEVYSGYGCATVELVSHYDYHVWPKRTTSVADDWIYPGNGIWELNEYAHAFFQRVAPAIKRGRGEYVVRPSRNLGTRPFGRHYDNEDYEKIRGAYQP